MIDNEIDQVKIANLGASCKVQDNLARMNQTTQYRSPEVILGAGFGAAVDIWSTACMAFELATGEYLFDPEEGPNYSMSADHLTQIMELLGSIRVPYNGDPMVRCNNTACWEWFHFRCVGLTVCPPKDVTWYCTECRSSFKRVPNQWNYENNEAPKTRNRVK